MKKYTTTVLIISHEQDTTWDELYLECKVEGNLYYNYQLFFKANPYFFENWDNLMLVYIL